MIWKLQETITNVQTNLEYQTAITVMRVLPAKHAKQREKYENNFPVHLTRPPPFSRLFAFFAGPFLLGRTTTRQLIIQSGNADVFSFHPPEWRFPDPGDAP
jgi:hypothetical protein